MMSLFVGDLSFVFVHNSKNRWVEQLQHVKLHPWTQITFAVCFAGVGAAQEDETQWAKSAINNVNNEYLTILRAQSFTSLKADLRQDINGGFAFSRSVP